MDGSVGGGEAADYRAATRHQSFGDELTHKPRRRCAERAAHGHFALAVFCADQEQAGDVDAGDEQQEASSDKRTSRIGRMSPTMASLRGMTSAPCPRLEPGYCFSSCAAMDFMLASAVWTETPSLSRGNGEEIVAAAPLFAAIGVVQGCPELGGAARGEMEFARQYADDDVGRVIES